MTTTLATTGTREIQFREAINECLRQEMELDENVIIMGEEIAGGAGREDQGFEDAWGGPFRTTVGLIQQFGKERVLAGAAYFPASISSPGEIIFKGSIPGKPLVEVAEPQDGSSDRAEQLIQEMHPCGIQIRKHLPFQVLQ